ncbi:MAG: ABC transporter permease subunit [Eubacterium sp.]|nr:ABC transporter permease subunit [Eubacterium sp.]
MTNVLYANFGRLFKSKIFYYGIVLVAVLEVLAVFIMKGDGENISGMVTLPLIVFPIILSALIGLLTSPEFSHGTIRNKMIVGHRRTGIYAAQLISMSVMTLICYAVYEIIVFTVGAAVLGTEGVSPDAVAAALAIMAVLLISNTAFSLFVCMVVHGSKSIALVLILQYGMMFVGVMSEMTGEIPTLKESAAFAVIDVIAKFVPQGYFTSLNIFAVPENPWQPILYSVVFGAAVTALGVLAFKKTDMK